VAGYRNFLFILPIVFVAQHEVAGWPIFGWLAKLQRSIFVNRDRRQAVHATISCIADVLTAGEVAGIFPEGTSTAGPDVFRFRSALIGAVVALLRWFGGSGDIRNDTATFEEITLFLQDHEVRSIAMTEAVMGCPHEEGIDYPEGEPCPFWAGRERPIVG
jgi:1-acyl-sn-glycerol-3-phosphate acyltransferase